MAVTLAVVAALVAVGVGTSGGHHSTSGSAEASNPLLVRPIAPGAPMPPAQLVLFDGATTSFAALRGKPVVVNFWAATCAPCVGEMPALEKLYLAYRDRVTFVGIDTAESAYAGRAMARTTGVTYLLASDPVRPHRAVDRGLRVAHHPRARPHGEGRARQGPGGHPPVPVAGLARPGAEVIDAPLAYAFGVGMVATVNPCGFAMLPAYLSFFLGLEG